MAEQSDFEAMDVDDQRQEYVPPWIKQGHKSSSSAEHFRFIGNEAFQGGNLRFALHCYNDSLRYAPIGSQETPLVYGSRSAVFCEMGEYGLAIENIELARKHGYPIDKVKQLNARYEKCKKLMEEIGPDKNSVVDSFQKLSHPPNEKIPFIAGCLELRKNEKYGRHIITNKDLKTGDIIAIEKPVMAWTAAEIESQSCFFCTRCDIVTLIPCSHCTEVMFCSEDCRKKAAPLHLNDKLYESLDDESIENTLKMQFEAYRIAGGVDEALELLKDAEGKTIFDFDFSDPDHPDYEKNMLIALNGLHRNADINCEIEIDPDELLNIPPINEKLRTAQNRERILAFILNQFRICCSNITIFKTTHAGIFLFRNLISHSCAPNIDSATMGDNLVSYACRPIKAGEQLFVCYGLGTDSKDERQMLLTQEFQFQCDCESCANDWPKQFSKKDHNFVEPEDIIHDQTAAIEEFEKNCKYIDENAQNMPCYEVATLIDRNHHLVSTVADFSIM